MSQKVNPKGFRLGEKTQFQTWESIWFSDPKKGKQKYSQLFHEDLTIKEYLKGFFRTFNFYVDKTVICRKINGDIDLISYVYRPAGVLLRQKGPGRSDSFFYANPKEKQLHEGLDQGWIPFSVLKIIGKHILWRFEAPKKGFCPAKGTGHRRHRAHEIQVIPHRQKPLLTPLRRKKALLAQNGGTLSSLKRE